MKLIPPHPTLLPDGEKERMMGVQRFDPQARLLSVSETRQKGTRGYAEAVAMRAQWVRKWGIPREEINRR